MRRPVLLAPLCVLLPALLALAGGGTHSEYLRRRDRIVAGDGRALYDLSRWCRRERLFDEERDALTRAVEAGDLARAARALEALREQDRIHSDRRTPWRREARFLYVETNTTEARLHEYCDTVAAFYNRFRKVFHVTADPLSLWGRPIGVKVFRTREDFDAYQEETGGSLGESAVGYYDAESKELILYEDPEDPEETRDTLFHEGTHLFQDLALAGRDVELPIWLSEGLAEYFGPARYDRESGELELGAVSPGRMATLGEGLEAGDLPTLREVVTLEDYDAFDFPHYAVAWALVHMLVEKREGDGGGPLYQGAFVRYYQRVAEGEPPVAAFQEALGEPEAFQGEFEDYVRALAPPG